MDLLDPKNDDVFKRLFADSPDLLAALISAVRYDEPPVEVLQVLNPHILPEDITGTAIELDVLARDSRGRLFNVEVQVQRFPRWSARSAFYLSRLLGSQIDAGQAYVNLKPVVGVHLLDFELFEGHRSALWHFEMRDRHDPSDPGRASVFVRRRLHRDALAQPSLQSQPLGSQFGVVGVAPASLDRHVQRVHRFAQAAQHAHPLEPGMRRRRIALDRHPLP